MSAGVDGAMTDPSLARALMRAGRYVGLALVVGSAVQGALAEKGLSAGLPWTVAFTTAGVALLFLLPVLADRALIPGGAGAGLRAEINRGNVAAAIVAAGHRAAVGIILSHCLYGADAATFLVSLAFLGIGFATLLLMQALYRRLTHYADDQEIRGENAAAALSFTGVSLALAIIVGHATWGSFEGWGTSIAGYTRALALALLLYPVRQVLVRCLLLRMPFAWRGGELDREIGQQRNVLVGAIEAIAYVGTALLVTGIL